jgi:hypothetical protein
LHAAEIAGLRSEIAALRSQIKRKRAGRVVDLPRFLAKRSDAA